MLLVTFLFNVCQRLINVTFYVFNGLNFFKRFVIYGAITCIDEFVELFILWRINDYDDDDDDNDYDDDDD